MLTKPKNAKKVSEWYGRLDMFKVRIRPQLYQPFCESRRSATILSIHRIHHSGVQYSCNIDDVRTTQTASLEFISTISSYISVQFFDIFITLNSIYLSASVNDKLSDSPLLLLSETLDFPLTATSP